MLFDILTIIIVATFLYFIGVGAGTMGWFLAIGLKGKEGDIRDKKVAIFVGIPLFFIIISTTLFVL